MSLKAIFLLIVNHSFEYPNYYQKLYSLLREDSTIYESKHLFTFFNLLDVSLRSNKISAKTIAAFIKVLVIFYFKESTPSLENLEKLFVFGSS